MLRTEPELPSPLQPLTSTPVETLAEWAVKPWSSRLKKMAQPGILRRNIYGGRVQQPIQAILTMSRAATSRANVSACRQCLSQRAADIQVPCGCQDDLFATREALIPLEFLGQAGRFQVCGAAARRSVAAHCCYRRVELARARLRLSNPLRRNLAERA
jgi:hypothetical protein